jgi:hypothetical protein
MVGVAVLAFSGGAYSVPPFCPDPDRKACQNTGEDAQGNNLSFPAILADGFNITPVALSFEVPYTGDYPGLTDDEIAQREASGPWYAQKVEGNSWQADYDMNISGEVSVDYVDWGDVIESVDPKVGRPTRLEVTLYQELATTMKAYNMALLEYPSSKNEVQGTNSTGEVIQDGPLTYESSFATVVSDDWTIAVQWCGEDRPEVPGDLAWDGEEWVECDPDLNISFAVELNVAGKYIFGASEGGWKPTKAGWYRITFYGPDSTEVNIESAEVGNFPFTTVEEINAEAEEGDEPAARPVVDGNLTYVDVQAVLGGGGGGGKGKPDRR